MSQQNMLPVGPVPDDLAKSNIRKEDKGKKDSEPEIGMEFESVEDAYNFYNKYAGEVGFSVRRHTIHRRNGVVHDRTFCCSSEGYRMDDKRRTEVKYHRPETRTGCLARITIVLQTNGKYRITHFEPSHNHKVARPEETHLLRSQRRLNPDQPKKVNSSGLQLKASTGFTSGQTEGSEDLSHVHSDCGNYLPFKRMRMMKQGDAGAILEYFEKAQLENKSSFHSMQLDMDDKITNIFWTDAKMVEDYGHFGDVVCFDTTYRLNEEGHPFASFVGVNHHKQAIIFGVALLYDETVESFTWLFKTFVMVMSGKEPRTILSDKCEAISKAIALVLPKACCRLCVWHVHQNSAKYLRTVFAGSRSFETDFSKCLYDCEEEDEFLAAWNSMLEKYDLGNNSWLEKLFKEKEEWASAYGRHIFCADINSALRSGNMNDALRNNLNTADNLLFFLKHFEKVLEDWRHKELKADSEMSESTQHFYTPVQMLKNARTIYTPAVFEMFEKEYLKGWDSDVHNFDEVGTLIKYKVSSNEKSCEHIVTFDSSDMAVACSCKKFEFVGILCGHALKVLDHKNIRLIPPRYIMKRWTKDSKGGNIMDFHGSAIQFDPKVDFGWHYQELYGKLDKIVARAMETEEGYMFASSYSDKLLQELEEIFERRNN
ncbi:PREDICTED: protein FAR1-RELATED SEQUENCE 5-like [Nelumbo nucifera]|uniref:Protein FAR1-RELATED SEQUENCE n=1 Tax=Nelumbo nucifera TaxID=4432 RepID=A0A1U7ZU13_NELNU|nr:PREDICTED: protein FAR1-RELATED SEQUENCE 5-like [Nelumbo nucifera]XP_010255613.1 PREDICTED: protein FAR1-RELATED SEQUENCE 5-like [Nelumbo nucifera]